MRKRIVKNQAKCLKCGDIIESKFTHDFRWCSCGNLAVDGGKSYIKRVAIDLTLVKEMTEYTVQTQTEDE